MKVEVEIPNGNYCNDGKESCIFWDYGGSGSLLPFCLRFQKHPIPERHKFPFESSIKLEECLLTTNLKKRGEKARNKDKGG